VLLSGYHDETGGAAVNAEVAKDRAVAVKDALVAAGLAADKVKMRKPAVTLGGADPAEARRVEVRVQ
jgi:outer membrane protein OmpA-like peptidoglycan-associated protein